jgi:hypothetical protein
MIQYNQIYKHYKNGEFYIPVEPCKIQMNDIWVEAVIYKDQSGNKYVRPIEEFVVKFQRK